MLFIAHELGVVRICLDRVAVMYLGQIMETGTTDEIFEQPGIPIRAACSRRRPGWQPEKRTRPPVLAGDDASPLEIPTGCRFRARCPMAAPSAPTPPPMVELSPTHRAACHFAQLT